MTLATQLDDPTPGAAPSHPEELEAFDQLDLVGLLKTMRALEYFKLSEVKSVVYQIVRNKLLRRIPAPAQQPEPSPKLSKRERLALEKRAAAAAAKRNVELDDRTGSEIGGTP